jgi:hypothetical protein
VAFRIDPALALPDALHAVALSESARALESLRRGADADVHVARQSGKKLRAWAQLLRPALAQRYPMVRRLLRDGARAVALTREATVAQATLAQLARSARLAADHRAGLAAAVERHFAISLAERAQSARQAEALFAAAREYLDGAALAELAAPRLDARLQRSLRDAAAGYRRALAQPTPAQLHDWRKQVKRAVYQCHLLAPLRLAPGVEPALRPLAERLGAHHDLEMLAQILPALDLDRPATRRRLLQQLRRRQAQLRREALQRGRALFASGARR